MGDHGTVILRTQSPTTVITETIPVVVNGTVITANFDGIYACDPQHWWIVGSCGTVVDTTNGGATWNQIDLAPFSTGVNPDCTGTNPANVLLTSVTADVTCTKITITGQGGYYWTLTSIDGTQANTTVSGGGAGSLVLCAACSAPALTPLFSDFNPLASGAIVRFDESFQYPSTNEQWIVGQDNEGNGFILHSTNSGGCFCRDPLPLIGTSFGPGAQVTEITGIFEESPTDIWAVGSRVQDSNGKGYNVILHSTDGVTWQTCPQLEVIPGITNGTNATGVNVTLNTIRVSTSIGDLIQIFLDPTASGECAALTEPGAISFTNVGGTLTGVCACVVCGLDGILKPISDCSPYAIGGTFTYSPTSTYTNTPCGWPGNTCTYTFSPTATSTPTNTNTPTITLTPSLTPTITLTYTPTVPPTITETGTSTNTPIVTCVGNQPEQNEAWYPTNGTAINPPTDSSGRSYTDPAYVLTNINGFWHNPSIVSPEPSLYANCYPNWFSWQPSGEDIYAGFTQDNDLFIRDTFTIPPGCSAQNPVLTFSADNEVDVYINGTLMGLYGPLYMGTPLLETCATLNTVSSPPLNPSLFTSGTNVIAFHVINIPGSGSDNPLGLNYQLCYQLFCPPPTATSTAPFTPTFTFTPTVTITPTMSFTQTPTATATCSCPEFQINFFNYSFGTDASCSGSDFLFDVEIIGGFLPQNNCQSANITLWIDNDCNFNVEPQLITVGTISINSTTDVFPETFHEKVCLPAGYTENKFRLAYNLYKPNGDICYGAWTKCTAFYSPTPSPTQTITATPTPTLTLPPTYTATITPTYTPTVCICDLVMSCSDPIYEAPEGGTICYTQSVKFTQLTGGIYCNQSTVVNFSAISGTTPWVVVPNTYAITSFPATVPIVVCGPNPPTTNIVVSVTSNNSACNLSCDPVKFPQTTITVTPILSGTPPSPSFTPTITPMPVLSVTPSVTAVPFCIQYDLMWSTGASYGSFNSPNAVAADNLGNVFVGDSGNGRIVAFDTTGNYSTQWTSAGPGNGVLGNTLWVAANSNGVYVLDSANNRVVQYTTNGGYIGIFGVSGSGQLSHPGGIALDSSGNVYVSDTGNRRVVEFSPTGTNPISIGVGVLNNPDGIAVDSSGDVFVFDDGTSQQIKKFTPGGNVLSWGGSGSGNGQFNYNGRLSVDPSGNVYVADTGNNRVQIFDNNGYFLTAEGSVYDTGTLPTQFFQPAGISVDNQYNFYVADTGNNRIQKFSPCPPIPPQCCPQYSFSWPQPPSADYLPGDMIDDYDLAVDASGYVYVADFGNGRVDVYDSNGEYKFEWYTAYPPFGVAVGPGNTIYTTETTQIEKFTLNGFLTPTTYPPIGSGVFTDVSGIAVDSQGYIYALDGSDWGSPRQPRSINSTLAVIS